MLRVYAGGGCLCHPTLAMQALVLRLRASIVAFWELYMGSAIPLATTAFCYRYVASAWVAGLCRRRQGPHFPAMHSSHLIKGLHGFRLLLIHREGPIMIAEDSLLSVVYRL